MPWVDLSVKSQMENAGVGTHLWIQYTWSDLGYDIINRTDGSNGIGLSLPPGAWFVKTYVNTASVMGRYQWQLVNTVTGWVCSMYHKLSKNVGDGAWETLQTIDFIANTENIAIKPNFSEHPIIETSTSSTMEVQIHAYKIR